MGMFDFITGGKGASYQPGAFNSDAGNMQNNILGDANSNATQKAGNQYAQGQLSLADIMNGVGQTTGGAMGIVQNPFSGTQLATDQVRNNPMFSGLYGQGGQMDQANAEATNLAQRGYSLQPEDYEAYGQASDQIARQFGQSENSLAQSLSDRGLAAGGGGVVGAQFAGMAGNKNEQLASQQRGIAQQRMQMNMQRLNNTRNFAAQLGQQANQALGSQADRNMMGVQNNVTNLANRFNQDQALHGMSNNEQMAAAKDDRAAQQPGLFQSALAGVNQGVNTGVANGVNGLFGGGPASNGTANGAANKLGSAATMAMV